MKILLVHNKYKYKGGEDSVFEAEAALLKEHGNNVFVYHETNSALENKKGFGKIIALISILFNINTYRKYSKIINDTNPDIIHVHNFWFTLSPSIFWIASVKKIPILFTVHNYRLICPNALMFRNGSVCKKCISTDLKLSSVIHKCYRNSSLQTFGVWIMFFFNKLLGTWKRKVSAYIFLTEFSKNIYTHSSLKRDLKDMKLYIKPNFVKNDFNYKNKKKFNRNNRFLYIGRLSKEKGIDTILDAIKFVNPDREVVLIGDGPMKEKVINTTKKYKNLIYLGYKDREYCLNYLKTSMTLVFPSVCYEGFPITILESFSTGTPVITSDIGNQANIVKDGFSGIHFKNDNPEDLASVINGFSFSEKFDLYKNSYEEYLKFYTPQKNYEQLMAIYEKTIEEYDKENR